VFTNINPRFLGAFAKLRKATISFVLSFCLSVLPHGTTQLPLDGLSWNWYFSNFRESVEKIQVSLKSDKNNGYCTRILVYIFNNITLNSFWNEKMFRANIAEKIKTHFIFSNVFQKSILLW